MRLSLLPVLLVSSLLIGCTLVSADLASEIEKAIEDAASCTACHALLVLLKVLAHLGNTAFDDVMIAICKAFDLEDDDVCEGAINEQGPILAHDLRKISTSGHTATLFCSSIFGLCSIPATQTYTVTFPSPSPTSAVRPTSTGGTTLKVAQLTDVHIDRFYTVGSMATCNKNICCRVYADSPSDVTDPAGEYGEPECDSPTALANSMLAAVKDLTTQVNFTIFTGDVVEGAVWLVTTDEVDSDLHEWNQNLTSSAIGTVYEAIGNHDVAPVNSFPRNTTSTTYTAQGTYDTASDWETWIGSSAVSSVETMSGCYSVVHPGTSLRIISFNTQYGYKQNFWLYDSDDFQPDPNGLLAWLVDELQAAETAGQRAWIIGHMPPGKPDALYDQSNYFNQIVQRYNETIAAQFYGHSHKDEFEIGYTDYSNRNQYTASSIAFISPALTPTSGNPSFRVYDVDPTTYEVMDYTEYFANMSSSTYQTSPTWEPLYSAREAYASSVDASYPSTAALDAAFWHRLVEAFNTTDSLFQTWYGRRDREYSGSTCDSTCKSEQLGYLTAMRSENNGYTPTAGFSFTRKRSLDTSATTLHGDDCDTSVLANTLARLASPNKTMPDLASVIRGVIGTVNASQINDTSGDY